MLNFKKIADEDLLSLQSYFARKKSLNCDFTLGVKFSRKDYFDSYFCIEDDTLFFREAFEKNKIYYSLPISKGDGTVFDTSKIVDDYFLNGKFPLEFVNLTKEESDYLAIKFPHNEIVYSRDWSDYLYLTNDFAEFKGNKYSAKRHHVNRFKKLYPNVVYVEAKEDELDEMQDFIKEFAETKNISTGEAKNEENAAIKLIYFYKKLGLRCFLLKDGEKIIGLTIIEIIGDCIFDHIEKCLREYDGIYSYIIYMTANRFKDVKYFNREDDSGDEGLRFSKESLHPIQMIDKYTFTILNNLDLLTQIPNIKIDENLSLSKINSNDKIAYKQLNLDDKNNKFWGYDYKQDLNGKNPDEDYFYNMAEEDFTNKTTLVFGIKLNNQLIGEVVFDHLTKDNGFELGYRLLKEFQHKGYAIKAIQAAINFAKNSVKTSYLLIKTYKENVPSLKIIQQLNPLKINEDEIFNYYKIVN